MPPRYIKLSAILANETLSVIDVHGGFLIGVGGLPPRNIKWSAISAKEKFNCDRFSHWLFDRRWRFAPRAKWASMHPKLETCD